MPSNADFEFEFIVPSVFASERGTHESSCFRILLMPTLRPDCCVLSNPCIRRLSAFPVVLTTNLYRVENVLEFCLFIGEKKGCSSQRCLWTHISWLVLHHVYLQSEEHPQWLPLLHHLWSEITNDQRPLQCWLHLRQQLLVYTQKICQIVRTAQ